MRKKLQVFISSTYTDLQEERQAAVEAVLQAGHIPAGMELFRSADESQKETITKWIKGSDAYFLILGGRYGSIEPVSGKSYTHWEYDLAGELNIPRFAVVITDAALDKKIEKLKQGAIEREFTRQYHEFKQSVLNKTSRFFDDLKDIKLTIMLTLNDLVNDEKLSGWVSGREIRNVSELSNTIAKLTAENQKLSAENQKLTAELMRLKSTSVNSNNSMSYNVGIDLEERLHRILTLLNATYYSSGGGAAVFGWDYESDSGDETKSFSFELPPEEFDIYFVDNEDGSYDKFLLLTQVEDDEELQLRLRDIRIQVKECRNAEGVPIHFIIALEGNHGELQEKASAYLDKALKLENVVDSALFRIEIWHSNVMARIEKELGLALEV